MRRLAPLLIALPALLGASGPVSSRGEPVDLSVARAQAEARHAEAQRVRLEQAADRAKGEAEQLAARQAAAAQAIAASEARISAAEGEQRLADARLAELRARLQRQQQPVVSLLAGFAMMGRRPPLLALADGTSLDELVRVRLLLDSTLPAIRARASALSEELRALEQLKLASREARRQLLANRGELEQRRRAFAALEARALRSEALHRTGAIAAGDVAIVATENADLLASRASRDRGSETLASELAKLGPAPLPRSIATAPEASIPYQLPAPAPVVNGFGEVSDSGIRARGVTLATRRGSPLQAPSDGIIRFSGPFRDYDGIVIMDHGGGWMSLIVNVASPLRPGSRITRGTALGRALGQIEVELSTNGRRVSPALIAGSSATLSKGSKGG